MAVRLMIALVISLYGILPMGAYKLIVASAGTYNTSPSPRPHNKSKVNYRKCRNSARFPEVDLAFVCIQYRVKVSWQ